MAQTQIIPDKDGEAEAKAKAAAKQKEEQAEQARREIHTSDQRDKFALLVRFPDTQNALALARANGWI